MTAICGSTSEKLRRSSWTTGGCRRMSTPLYTSVELLWKELEVTRPLVCTSLTTWPGPFTLRQCWHLLISESISCEVSGSLVSPQNPKQLLQMHHWEHPDWVHDCLSPWLQGPIESCESSWTHYWQQTSSLTRHFPNMMSEESSQNHHRPQSPSRQTVYQTVSQHSIQNLQTEEQYLPAGPQDLE